MKILVINGPNLNMLGKRNKAIYGDKTLARLETTLKNQGKKLGAEVITFQSNSEGQIIDFIQANYCCILQVCINIALNLKISLRNMKIIHCITF